MGQFTRSGASQITKDAIVAALSSGSIKLLGTGGKDWAEGNAKADAKYLSTLANTLHEQLLSGAEGE
jgi:hypothetical protein